MKSFFSIIIPTYNRATYLGHAIESVLSQTFTDFEIVIVDDGSTDNTESIVKQMRDRRIRYFKKKNEERSIARNFGIQKAQGQYVNFLDSDDIFYPHHLVTAHQLLKKYHFPEVGHLGYEMVNSKREILLQRNDLDEHIPKRMLHENILHGNAIFIRQDIALQYPFIPSPKAVISEDWYLWIRLVTRFRIYYDNTITSAIVEHEQRSLRNINLDKLVDSTEIIIEYLKNDKIFLKKYHGEVGYFFANHYTFLTLILALSKKRRLDTIKYLGKALLYDWTVIVRKRFLASLKHLF